MSKYKAGDKFIIEIEDVLHIESDEGLWVEPWYRVNGMEGTYFEEDDLDSLERYDGDKELPAFDFDDLETLARLLQAYVDITRRYIYGEDGA